MRFMPCRGCLNNTQEQRHGRSLANRHNAVCSSASNINAHIGSLRNCRNHLVITEQEGPAAGECLELQAHAQQVANPQELGRTTAVETLYTFPHILHISTHFHVQVSTPFHTCPGSHIGSAILYNERGTCSPCSACSAVTHRRRTHKVTVK